MDHPTPEYTADWVRVPRAKLELILDRYRDGDTSRDDESDFALAALYNALGPQHAAGGDIGG